MVSRDFDGLWRGVKGHLKSILENLFSFSDETYHGGEEMCVYMCWIALVDCWIG